VIAAVHRACLIALVLLGAASCSFDASKNPKHGCPSTCKKDACMFGFCWSEGKSADAGSAGKGVTDGGTTAVGTTDGGPTGQSDSGTAPTDAGKDAAPGDAGKDAAPPETCTADRFCFDGPRDSAAIGSCRAGNQACENGTYGACLGQVLPADERCNGQDDDCDGMIDEDAANGSCAADNAQGECKTAVLSCEDGVIHCRPKAMPTTETCNGLDDDCDGTTDEGTDVTCYPAGNYLPGTACTQATDGSWTCQGVCKTGVQACSGGKLGSCAGFVMPASEVCTASGGTAADENCDGRVDEGCTCANGQTQTCYSGPDGTAGVGTCKNGTQMCSSNNFGDCMNAVTPAAETCMNPGADDDCNHVVDDVPGLGNGCLDSSKHGPCIMGTLSCQGTSSAAPTCVTPTGTTEVCDGHQIDEDCDGTVDEGFDLKTDAANCGACGHSCKASEACCNGTCVDTTNDDKNCGMCTTSCGTGYGCCASACHNLQAEPNNCGACGMACSNGATCCGGGCCPSGSKCCGTSCVDLNSDPNNCNACGHRCPTGNGCCGGTCVDLQTSTGNCGTCGNSCALIGLTCKCMNGKCPTGLCL
jgi:hypothetical protein